MNTEKKTQFKVFIPDARVLTESEKASLPKDKMYLVR